VTCSVLTDTTCEWFLPCVYFDMPIQQSLSYKAFPASRPGASIPVRMALFGVESHVSFTEKRNSAAEMRSVEALVHRHHVPLQVVPAVGLVVALGKATVEWFISFFPLISLLLHLAVRWSHLQQRLHISLTVLLLSLTVFSLILTVFFLFLTVFGLFLTVLALFLGVLTVPLSHLTVLLPVQSSHILASHVLVIVRGVGTAQNVLGHAAVDAVGA